MHKGRASHNGLHVLSFTSIESDTVLKRLSFIVTASKSLARRQHCFVFPFQTINRPKSFSFLKIGVSQSVQYFIARRKTPENTGNKAFRVTGLDSLSLRHKRGEPIRF